MEAFGRSLESDARLALYDVRACRAHVQMLQEAGVLSGGRVLAALQEMEREIADGSLRAEGPFEDVHSWVEAVLADRVGDEASSIRLGRSRNDLVATDFRLWTRDAVASLRDATADLQDALLEQAERHPQAVMPGYTHLQRAQPVLVAHHMLAHFWALERDRERFAAVGRSADCCPLGAAALAGSPWPIRPERTAELLGFSRAFANSLDAVSDRDFAVELLSAAALAMVHLSRLAEEVILWTSQEFGFAELDDAWSTGSSLMPQKKNPDPAELVRGRTGAVMGRLTALLVTLKGLPLAYNRDLQEDKPPVFEAVDILLACLGAMEGTVRTMQFRTERLAEAAADPNLLATDLADGLVRAGYPFSRAHELAGRAAAGRLTDEEAQVVTPLRDSLDARSALEARAHPGAAGPASVSAQLAEARRLLGPHFPLTLPD